MDWFTSDLHLGHANIIKYSKRPFANTEEMDAALIKNINDVVLADDRLWFLGDFCFGPRETNGFCRKAEGYRNQINCNNIIWIHGNHDPKEDSERRDEQEKYRRFRQLFSADYALRNTKINGQAITLCHYKLAIWDKSHHGAWHLWGHSHGSAPDDPNALSFDCGVDCHNYKPLNLTQVGEIMAKKTFKPIDHHGARDHEQ